MRPQEYLVLPRRNLDTAGVLVDQALDAGGQQISVTKTKAGRRFIEISPHTMDMVRHYAENQAFESSYDLIFPVANGRWMTTNNWRRRGFLAACREAGLVSQEQTDEGETVEVPKYKPYDLRHFYASMLIEQRVNLKKIQRLMGHSDIQTTLNVYGHVIEKAEDDDPATVGVLSAIRAPACGDNVARTL